MSSKAKSIIILLLLCVLIAVIPLTMSKNKGSEFGGADGEAETAITEINPNYEAWASPILEPPGGETESLLFCLQAGLGAGVFGYLLGVLRERAKHESKAESQPAK